MDCPDAVEVLDGCALIPESFCLTPLEFDVVFCRRGALTDAPGVAVRGALGRALRSMSPHHTEGSPVCDCPYCVLFCHGPRRVGVSADGSPIVADLPPRFILRVDQFPAGEIRPGDRARIAVALVGSDPDHVHLLTRALRLAGEYGIGGPRAAFEVRADPSPPRVIDRPMVLSIASQMQGRREARVRFQTTALVRVKTQRQLALTFDRLIESILNRLHRGLAHHWGDHEAAARTGAIRRRLVQQARQVRSERVDLTWVRDKRARLGKDPQSLGGFIGSMWYSGALDPFWPLIAAGSFTHIGYGAAFGMGRYDYDAQGGDEFDRESGRDSVC